MRQNKCITYKANQPVRCTCGYRLIDTATPMKLSVERSKDSANIGNIAFETYCRRCKNNIIIGIYERSKVV